jgi:hypothetical protein
MSPNYALEAARKGAMYSPSHPRERRNFEAADTIGISGENIIIRFGVNVGEMCRLIPEKRSKTGV